MLNLKGYYKNQYEDEPCDRCFDEKETWYWTEPDESQLNNIPKQDDNDISNHKLQYDSSVFAKSRNTKNWSLKIPHCNGEGQGPQCHRFSPSPFDDESQWGEKTFH